LLSAPLQFDRNKATAEIYRVTSITRKTPGTTATAIQAARGSASLIAGRRTGYAPLPAYLRVWASPGTAYYHFITAAPTVVTPKPITLKTALNLPHSSGEPLILSAALFDVFALDAATGVIACGWPYTTAIRRSCAPLFGLSSTARICGSSPRTGSKREQCSNAPMLPEW
jgi:hypothetical protein